MSLVCIYVIINTIYSAVRHSAHVSSIGLHADPQEGLFFEAGFFMAGALFIAFMVFAMFLAGTLRVNKRLCQIRLLDFVI